MKSSVLCALCVTLCVTSNAQEVEPNTAVFDWTNPMSLTPSYPAPDSGNRYGEYVGKVEFSADKATFMVDDSQVAEQSRSARFLFGYYTMAVELRAYQESTIIIKVPEDYAITSVSFTGPEVDATRLEALGDYASWTGTQWHAKDGESVSQVSFYCNGRVELSSTTVNYTAPASVNDITSDVNTDEATTWVDAAGRIYTTTPDAKGFYIERRGSKVRKVCIR